MIIALFQSMFYPIQNFLLFEQAIIVQIITTYSKHVSVPIYMWNDYYRLFMCLFCNNESFCELDIIPLLLHWEGDDVK